MEYRIEYWPVEVQMKPVMAYKITAFNLQAPVNSTRLQNLGTFTKYAIRVAAVTQTGIGAYTNTQYGGNFFYNQLKKFLQRRIT